MINKLICWMRGHIPNGKTGIAGMLCGRCNRLRFKPQFFQNRQLPVMDEARPLTPELLDLIESRIKHAQATMVADYYAASPTKPESEEG